MSLVEEQRKLLEIIEKIDGLIESTKSHREKARKGNGLKGITYYYRGIAGDSSNANDTICINEAITGFDKESGIVDEIFALYLDRLTDWRAKVKEQYFTAVVRNSAL